MSDAPPSTEEIVKVLRSFLYEHVAPQLDEFGQFQCRVAVNLLGILGRELISRREVAGQQQSRLADILGDQHSDLVELSEALAALIRAGKVPLDDERVVHHTRQTQTEMLSISNPRWLTSNSNFK